MSIDLSPSRVRGYATPGRAAPDATVEPSMPLGSFVETARWTAHQRARETERPDAVFRDPLAARLVGESAALSDADTRHAWPFIARTHLFDRFIRERIRAGADTVLNLAAGLDTRPYRMELPASVRWVEVDLPDIIAYKNEILQHESPRCRLERIALDLRQRHARRELFLRIGREARSTVVVTEGFLIYLKQKEVVWLAEDLAAGSAIHYWVTDLASPGLLPLLQKQMSEPLEQATASLEFAPSAGAGFFYRHGWKPIAVSSLLRTAARLGRVPLPMRLLALLPEPRDRLGSRPWGGSLLLERR